MKIGEYTFNREKHTYIMGILNVTPDSFSDGGCYNSVERSLFRVKEMIRQGVDIIDIGGESSRPNYVQISEEEEIERILPIIERVKSEFNICVSLDTYKSKVAKVGLEYGVDMINDIWGLKYDDEMADVIAKAKKACCIMHNRKENIYSNFVQDVMQDLNSSIEIAVKAGINRDNIILDPGVGFAKNYEQNLEIIRNVATIKKLGFPVLLGTSRKSVIGLTLDLPVEQRLEGTLATTAWGVMQGCNIVRVHDIEENARLIYMLETIIKANNDK